MKSLLTILLVLMSTNIMADVYMNENTEYIYNPPTVVEEYYDPYPEREIIRYNPNVTIHREYIVTPSPRVVIRRPTVIYYPDYYRW